jgi:hypothetical protein
MVKLLFDFFAALFIYLFIYLFIFLASCQADYHARNAIILTFLYFGVNMEAVTEARPNGMSVIKKPH